MNDSVVSSTQAAGALEASWLLLVYHLPPKPDYLRVKLRRRLLRLGAVALKNAAYVLPKTDECLEDFQWLRREIADEGGEASVCVVAPVDGLSDAELVTMFQRDRTVEYAVLAEQASALAAEATPADIERLRKQLGEIMGRDFFGAPGRDDADRAIGRLRQPASAPANEGGPARPPGAPLSSGAVWVTREGVHVDRMASAWLITRFIDQAARFKFVHGTAYNPEPGERRFDMFEGEFTHEGDRCTFETLLRRFGMDDPSLAAIGELVHDIDCKDAKFQREATDGVATVVRGICLTHGDDIARVEAAAAMFDGLYAHFREQSV